MVEMVSFVIVPLLFLLCEIIIHACTQVTQYLLGWEGVHFSIQDDRLCHMTFLDNMGHMTFLVTLALARGIQAILSSSASGDYSVSLSLKRKY